MTKYDHYTYCREISRKLKGIRDYLESVGEEDPSDVDEKLRRLKSPVLVAVDDFDTDYSFIDDDNLVGTESFIILILFKARENTMKDIKSAKEQAKELMNHVRAKILKDYHESAFGLGELLPDSLKCEGVGAYADSHYGMMLSYTVSSPVSYELDDSAWL